MRPFLAFALMMSLLVAALIAAVSLSPGQPWLVFHDGPALYDELAAQGMTTPDGLFGSDGRPLGDFVIVVPAEGPRPRRQEGYFRSHLTAEAFLLSQVSLPKPQADWQMGVLRASKEAAAGAAPALTASAEYRHSSGAHILAIQSTPDQRTELPPARAVGRSEVHEVNDKDVTVLWLNVSQGGRLFASWASNDSGLTVTLSTTGPPDLQMLLDFVRRTRP